MARNRIAFGEKIKRLREERGMTQQALADRLYVTRQAVSQWENGARYPDIFTLRQIAQVLGISVDELLEEKAAAVPMEPPAEEGEPDTGPLPDAGARAGSRTLLALLYAAAAGIYFLMSIIDILGLISMGRPSLSAGYLMVASGGLCDVARFALTLVGICFSAAGIMRPGRAGIIGGLYYGAAFLNWLGTTGFLWEKQVEVSGNYILYAAVSIVLPAALTLWYFFSGRRLPFFLLLLPMAALLYGNVFSINASSIFVSSSTGFSINIFRMGANLLVQAAVVYQGYIWERMCKYAPEGYRANPQRSLV